MNHTNISNLKGKAWTKMGWKAIVIFAILVSTILITSIANTVKFNSQSAVAKPKADFLLATNPELSVARRHIKPANILGSSEFLANNPELKQAGYVAAGYQALPINPELLVTYSWTIIIRQSLEAKSLAANPELSAVHRYTKPAEIKVKASFLIANPELKQVSYVATGYQATTLNPELRVASRWTKTIRQVSEARFLTINPELSIVNRYVKPVDIQITTNAWVINPELMVANRYSNQEDETFLSINPEFKCRNYYNTTND
jgi:hypothetical protein